MVRFEMSAASVEDGRLMWLYYHGDDVALGNLGERRRPGLIALAMRWLPQYLPSRYELAEDMVSDVFVNVMATRTRPQSQWSQEKGEVRTWLSGVLRNRIMSFLRTKKGKERLSADSARAGVDNSLLGGVEARVAHEDDPAKRIEKVEQMQQLLAAMRRLPAEDRRVLIMKFWDNQPYRVISQTIGASTPTVCRRIQAARQTLLEALQD